MSERPGTGCALGVLLGAGFWLVLGLLIWLVAR
jgi:hypothetical protein